MNNKRVIMLITCFALLVGCGTTKDNVADKNGVEKSDATEEIELSEEIIELIDSGEISLPTDEELKAVGYEESQGEWLQEFFEDKPNDLKKILKSVDANGNVDIPEITALVSDVTDNNDGTYTVTFTECKEWFKQNIEEAVYDSLSVGCELPFESYRGDNFICYDDSDGYFFSENGEKPSMLNDADSIWIKKDQESGTIKVFYNAFNVFTGYTDYYEMREIEDFTYPIRGDLHIQIRNENFVGVNNYTFEEFYNSDDVGFQNYKDTWKNLYLVELTFNPGDAQINYFVEEMMAG